VYEQLETGMVPPVLAHIEYELVGAEETELAVELDPGETAILAVASERSPVLLTDGLAARDALRISLSWCMAQSASVFSHTLVGTTPNRKRSLETQDSDDGLNIVPYVYTCYHASSIGGAAGKSSYESRTGLPGPGPQVVPESQRARRRATPSGGAAGQVLAAGHEEVDETDVESELTKTICNYCVVGCGFNGERKGNTFVGGSVEREPD
jgi:Molybdopterin oxidoreductase Fe4S4 domain.